MAKNVSDIGRPKIVTVLSVYVCALITRIIRGGGCDADVDWPPLQFADFFSGLI